jgi:alcohol dehydrogenase (cytochrome c)
MLWANKNGLMYVFDRATGQFLMGTPFGEVNWMDGFDGKGRPVLIAKNGSNTATDWFPFSYSPTAGLFYFPVRQPTNEFRGAMYGAIRAFDPITGSQVWEFRKNNAAFAGVLTTASDLLFTGCADPWGIPRQFDCEFLALNDRTGQLLWQMPLPGSVRGGPMTYAVAGKQFVAAEAGNTLFVFGLRQ